MGIGKHYSEKRFGVELDEFSPAPWNTNSYRLTFKIHVKVTERHMREALNVSPVFATEEIRNQISNLPKWKSFVKAFLIISQQWATG